MNQMSTETLESFVNDRLREDLHQLEVQLNRLNEETTEYVQLKHQIAAIRDHAKGSFKTKVNIGGDFFMQARVPSTKHIVVNLGANTFLEMSLDEAEKFVEAKIRIMEKKAEIIREESLRVRAEIKLALLCIGEKTQLHQSAVD